MPPQTKTIQDIYNQTNPDVPPENLIQFLRQFTTSAAPVSTGLNRDKMKPFAYMPEYSPKRFGKSYSETADLHTKEESLIDFINTIQHYLPESVDPQKTMIGRTITELLEGYNEVKILPAFTGRANFIADTRSPDSPDFPVDTVNVNTLSDLIAELAHVKQFDVSPASRDSLSKKVKEDFALYGDTRRYETPGTIEHYAHEILEPKVRDKAKALLDSLYGNQLVELLGLEDLLKNRNKMPPHNKTIEGK
jgi:hypothetical protein